MAASPDGELTVCDIMGEWGAYQWSLTLFGLVYSSIISVSVVVGPIWTPDLEHVCASSVHMANSANIPFGDAALGQLRQQCFLSEQQVANTTEAASQQLVSPLPGPEQSQQECTSFVYNDAQYGKVLTNTFDLVCSRKWLRSFLSSSALIGMLLSSVTLGLTSDKLGRIKNIKIGMTVAILATVGAIFAQNYFLLNVCILFMSYGQVDVANAISCLVMESTSPRWRFASVFEYSMGWALGMLLVPLLNESTKNYQHLLVVMLVWQLLMLLWLRWGVFESIRWLLSEGKINQAQIELQRACRMNGVRNGADLAHKIASVQAVQVRKASSVIDEASAPERLAKATQRQVDDAAQELSILGAALRRSFALDSPAANNSSADHLAGDPSEAGAATTADQIRVPQLPVSLSPTLTRRSFSLQSFGQQQQQPERQQNNITSSCAHPNPSGQHDELDEDRRKSELLVPSPVAPESRNSITTQGLIQLTLKYSKTLHEQEEGKFFLAQMFHRKLYKLTLLGMLLSVVLETTYYGLVQATRFIGFSVNLNYIVGSLSEALAACTFAVVLTILPRRAALIIPTLVSAAACLGIATSYHLLSPGARHAHSLLPPDGSDTTAAWSSVAIGEPGGRQAANASLGAWLAAGADSTGTNLQDNADLINPAIASNRTTGEMIHDDDDLERALSATDLRERINFWLMTLGKVAVNNAMQTSATIVMEAYPNNLRQSGSGSILFVGRICSIMSPFLFNDLSEERTVFKATLVTIASISVVVCILVPFLLRDTSKELSDRLNDIEDDDADR